MKTRMALETELEMAHRRIDALKSELHEAYEDIQRLNRENYALQIDNDIISSAVKTIATRKAAEIVNGIMTYETKKEYQDFVSSLADLYADKE